MEENKDQSGIDIIKKAMERPSIFKDEKPLSLEFIPSKLHHRENEFLTLAQIFKSVMEKPSTTSQRVLISGDIGTGKSTILLSIDFALFGIRRGELPGNSLLRNGESQGSTKEYSDDIFFIPE